MSSTERIIHYLTQIQELERKSIEIKRELIESNSMASIYQKDKEKLSFVLLQVRDRTIAVPILFVTEIVPMVKLVPSAETVTGVAGMVNYCGEMYSVIDIGELIGFSKCPASIEKYIAICHLESFRFALLIDDIIDLATVKMKDIEVEEELLAGSLKAMGIVQYAGRTSLIIDLWSILYSIQMNSSQESRTNLLTSVSDHDHQGKEDTM